MRITAKVSTDIRQSPKRLWDGSAKRIEAGVCAFADTPASFAACFHRHGAESNLLNGKVDRSCVARRSRGCRDRDGCGSFRSGLVGVSAAAGEGCRTQRSNQDEHQLRADSELPAAGEEQCSGEGKKRQSRIGTGERCGREALVLDLHFGTRAEVCRQQNRAAGAGVECDIGLDGVRGRVVDGLQ